MDLVAFNARLGQEPFKWDPINATACSKRMDRGDQHILTLFGCANNNPAPYGRQLVLKRV